MNISNNSFSTEIIVEKYDIDGKLIDTKNIPTQFTSENNVEIKKFNENGDEIEKIKFPVKSFVRNYISGISGSMAGVANPRMTLLNGTNSTISAYKTCNKFANGANFQSNWGLLFGKNIDGISNISSESVTLNDYNLKNLIPHGNVSGTLFYGDFNYNQIVVSESFYKCNQYGVVSNQSDVTMSIGEVGGIVQYNDGSGYFLSIRDIYDNSGNLINISIAPNQTMYAEYNYILNTSSLFPNRNWLAQMEIDMIENQDSPYTYINPVGLQTNINYRKGIKNRTDRTIISDNHLTTTVFSAAGINEAHSPGYITSVFDAQYKLFTDGDYWLRLLANANGYGEVTWLFLGESTLRDFDITYSINTETTSSWTPGFRIRGGIDLFLTTGGIMPMFISSSFAVGRPTSTSAGTIESSVAKNFEKDTTYKIRFYASHSVVKAKAWASGTAEPGAWDIDYITTTTNTGYVGLYQWPPTNGRNASKYIWYNDFEITYLELNSSSLQNNYIVSYAGGNQREQILRWYCAAPAGYYTCGIVVGSNDYTQSNNLIDTVQARSTDFRLNNIIPEGTGSGEISYQTCYVSSNETSVSSSYIEINRTMLNSSLDEKRIREIGLYQLRASSDTNVLSTKYAIYNGFNVCVGRVLTGSDVVLTTGQSVNIKMRLYFKT